MAHLSLTLLGSFQVMLDGKSLVEFKSNKVRALLAYLAVESDRPHRREMLAGLLWPDWSNRDALSNLRYALSDLRGVIGDREADPRFLLIARDCIQFNLASDHFLDVRHFIESAEADKSNPNFIQQLEKARDLYRGDFLEGFSLEDSSAFEEWTLRTRERLAQLASSLLHTLANSWETNGDYEKAQSCAYQNLELEPWDESAYRVLMRTLALKGQRNAALAQYEKCRELLASELDVDPSDETTELYDQIREGKLKAIAKISLVQSEPFISPPAFLTQDTSDIETPVFVARSCELARLNTHLDAMLSGKGHVVFITGEAGSGKTSLIQEFTRQAQETHQKFACCYGELQCLHRYR
jgi:DNA-binding SARP family transcriptional activator